VWLVRTDDLDLLQQGKADFDATKGDVIDLVIQVVRGGSIEGEVRWPDGTPVDDFEVEVTDPIRKIEDGDGGRFRLLGLSEGRYRLEVRAVRAGFTGQVEVPGVEPNRAPLDLILQEAPDCKLSGLVVDGSDEPVGKFSVRAYREEGPGSASVDGIAGQFRLSGLTPGAWILYVHAEGCQEVEQRVDVEAESNSELRIVLLSAGRIRGRVLDSRNTPVAGAWVGEDHMAFTIKFFGPRDQATDSLGAFDIEVQSTHLLLVAIANGYASSEVLALEIEPGQTLENVELHLRDACRVEGRVLDEHGAPVGAVHVFAPEFESLGINTETDARGAFALEGLPAGRTKVVAWHEDRPGALASAWITLAPGPPVSLELRFQAPDPVRLHGRVSRGGSSLASALGMRTASFFLDFTSSTDGRFEATLQQPGEWLGFVRGMDEEPSTDLREMDLRRFTVVVPDLEEYELVLDFDTLARVISPEELWR